MFFCFCLNGRGLLKILFRGVLSAMDIVDAFMRYVPSFTFMPSYCVRTFNLLFTTFFFTLLHIVVDKL